MRFPGGHGTWLGNASLGLEQAPKKVATFPNFVRVENLADREYVGSVIVNESNRSITSNRRPGRAMYLNVQRYP